MGRGCQIFWPYNSPSKSCCPAPQMERTVLMSSGPCHGLSSPILIQCQSLFACLRHVSNGGDFSSLYGRENPCGYFNWGYKYPFEPICLFTFTSKSSCAHTLNLVKCSAKLTPSFNIKCLPEKLFLISVRFLLSLTRTFSFLSFFSSYPFPSFAFP